MNNITRNRTQRGQSFFDYIIVIAIVIAVTFFIVNRFKDSIESILTQPSPQNQPLQPF